MSIASRYVEMQKHVGNAYTEISRLGVDLTNVDKNIDNIADKLQDVYADLPKVTDEGSSLSLTPTRKGGLSIIPKGACEQDSYSGYQLLKTNEINFGANTNNNIEIEQLSIGTYIFSGENISGDGRFNLKGVKADDTEDSLLSSELTKNIPNGYTFTTTAVYKQLKLFTNVALSGKIQLESGSTKHSWEPYTRWNTKSKSRLPTRYKSSNG